MTLRRSAATAVTPAVLEAITQALRSLRYGTVHITVHAAQVVQIEKTEKLRVQPSADLTPGSATDDGPPDRMSGGARPSMPD